MVVEDQEFYFPCRTSKFIVSSPGTHSLLKTTFYLSPDYAASLIRRDKSQTVSFQLQPAPQQKAESTEQGTEHRATSAERGPTSLPVIIPPLFLAFRPFHVPRSLAPRSWSRVFGLSLVWLSPSMETKSNGYGDDRFDGETRGDAFPGRMRLAFSCS